MARGLRAHALLLILCIMTSVSLGHATSLNGEGYDSSTHDYTDGHQHHNNYNNYNYYNYDYTYGHHYYNYTNGTDATATSGNRRRRPRRAKYKYLRDNLGAPSRAASGSVLFINIT